MFHKALRGGRPPYPRLRKGGPTTGPPGDPGWPRPAPVEDLVPGPPLRQYLGESPQCLQPGPIQPGAHRVAAPLHPGVRGASLRRHRGTALGVPAAAGWRKRAPARPHLVVCRGEQAEVVDAKGAQRNPGHEIQSRCTQHGCRRPLRPSEVFRIGLLRRGRRPSRRRSCEWCRCPGVVDLGGEITSFVNGLIPLEDLVTCALSSSGSSHDNVTRSWAMVPVSPVGFASGSAGS